MLQLNHCRFTFLIDGLQSIPRDSNDKDVAAMLVQLTIEADEESFVIVLKHGGNDVTCKGSPGLQQQRLQIISNYRSKKSTSVLELIRVTLVLSFS